MLDFKKSEDDESNTKLRPGYAMPDISQYTYGINVTVESEGLALLEVYVNDEQVSVSLRLFLSFSLSLSLSLARSLSPFSRCPAQI